MIEMKEDKKNLNNVEEKKNLNNVENKKNLKKIVQEMINLKDLEILANFLTLILMKININKVKTSCKICSKTFKNKWFWTIKVKEILLIISLIKLWLIWIRIKTIINKDAIHLQI